MFIIIIIINIVIGLQTPPGQLRRPVTPFGPVTPSSYAVWASYAVQLRRLGQLRSLEFTSSGGGCLQAYNNVYYYQNNNYCYRLADAAWTVTL
jgi:hypothetical protein